MKGILVVLFLLVAGVVGLGFYMGWFHLGWDKADDKDHVTLTVDEKKVQEDKKKAEEKVHDLEQQAKDKTAGPGKTKED